MNESSLNAAQALLLEALTGRVVPIPVNEGECPPEVPQERAIDYQACSKLVMDPDFHRFLKMVREGQMAVVSGLRSDTASAEQMRSALAKQELALTLGDFALNYIAEVDSLISARAKWLEENKETGDKTQK